ncbi:nitroreductase family protein, partial [Klebsiella pneumoniae]|uniref:nitroreductase family protein n=1 Tax=Klebsiella pneumoniae TaxID=573 RepID=UPI0016533200
MTMNIDQPETSSDETLSFKETVRARRSIRGFLDKTVPLSIIREVLEDAQNAPSNCNTQPWNT